MQAKNDEYGRVKAQINQLQDTWETAMLEAEEWEKKLA
jgi:ATP-binding cassette subfamily F protein 3